MATFSRKSNSQNHYHLRSISWPARSHPSIVRIEQLLTKHQVSEVSGSPSNAESICSSLSNVQELHKCIQQLISLQGLSRKSENWVKGMLEESISYMDICCNIRDVIIQLKESLHELQSAVRRRSAYSSMENAVKAYFCIRKKMNKEIYKGLTNLKQTGDPKDVKGAIPTWDLDEDQSSAATMRFLPKASLKTASILESLLLFLSVQTNTRWPLVSKFLHKVEVETEGQRDSQNEIVKVETELRNVFLLHQGSSKDIAKADRLRADLQKKLNDLDSTLQNLEYGLESLLRRLISTRVSLLNFLSDC